MYQGETGFEFRISILFPAIRLVLHDKNKKYKANANSPDRDDNPTVPPESRIGGF